MDEDIQITRTGYDVVYESTGKRIAVRTILFALISALLFLWAVSVLLLFAALPDVTVDIDEKVSMPVLETPLYSKTVSVSPGLSEIDTSRTGTTDVRVTVYGMFSDTVKVTVEDRTPPEFTLRTITGYSGIETSVDDYITGWEDKTEVSFRFGKEPDASSVGINEVIIEAEDEGGNISTRSTSLTIVPDSDMPVTEFGMTEKEIEDAVKEKYPDFYDWEFDINASECGKYPFTAKTGDGDVSLCVFVRDTVPPVGTTESFDIVLGDRLTVDDFVTSMDDLSGVTADFIDDPGFDIPGSKNVRIALTDGAGNITEIGAVLNIWDVAGTVTIEEKISDEKFYRTVFPDYNGDEKYIPKLDEAFDPMTASIGDHDTVLHGMFEDIPVHIYVADRTPPEGKPVNHDVVKGDRLEAGDFVCDVFDVTPVTIRYAEEPDFSSPGKQTVSVILSDITDNETVVESELIVWDVAHRYRCERGRSQHSLVSAVSSKCGGTVNVLSAPDTTKSEPGEYDFVFAGTYDSLTVSVEIVDTTPPELILKEATVYTGAGVSIDSFLKSVSDISGASAKLDSIPDTSYVHTETVTVTAADPYGNTTTGTAELNVIADTTPPVIYGVKNITVTEGETVSLRKNVYAEDNRDGTVNVNVDSSGLNTKAEGKYTVTYSASDSSGNTATATATVTVRAISESLVNSYADSILSGIVWNGMTETEKAWAVYSWVTSNIGYSTSTSYLMGQFYNAAYSGMTSYSGNCYVYYAVSSVLLTRAGITNMQICRNSTTNPHYWNLVQIGGCWYHFDACPHYAAHPLTCFLLTDADVAAYTKNEVAGYYSFDSWKYPATP